jgi:tetratricopeptide (TPR) repeat protein
MSRQNDIKKQIVQHNRRLQILKEKKAAYGLETPVSVLTEIADIESQIEALQAELEQLPQNGVEVSGDPANTRKSRFGRTTIFGVSVIGGVLVLAAVVCAVSALALRPNSKSKPLEGFSVDRPENGEELPLDETQSWTLEGQYPKDLEETANIDVEILKLPEGRSIPQAGKLHRSTIKGFWRFAPVNFDGEGTYEVVVSVSGDGEEDFHSINVRCLEKAAVYESAIVKDRQIRGVSPLVVATREEVSLGQLKQELNQMQKQFFELYPHDLDGALEIVYETFDALDPVLPIFPDDYYLQNVRAYNFKNYAMVMQKLNNPEEFERALKEAEKMFEVIRQQNPDDASAWNGLGSVALLRNDPDKALNYIDMALELNPNYPAAKKDRETALTMKEKIE